MNTAPIVTPIYGDGGEDAWLGAQLLAELAEHDRPTMMVVAKAELAQS